jgi:hypothetical protein
MSKFVNNKFKTMKIKSNNEGIVDDVLKVVDTGLSVVNTVEDVLTGNIPRLVQEAPKTINKVLETGQQLFNTKATMSESVQQEVISQLDTKPSIQDNVVKTMPIITTTQIPSSYATQFQNAPSNFSTETVGFRGSNSAVRITGSTWFSNGAYHATSSSTIQPVYVNYLFVTGGGPFAPLFGLRMATMASLYQFFFIEGFEIHYVPNQPTSQPGTMYVTFHDGQEAFPTLPTINQISQNERFAAISAYTGGSIKWTTFDPYGRYYCSMNTAGTDYRWYSPGIVGIYSVGNNQVSFNGLPGQFYSTFRIILYGALYGSLDYNKVFHQSIFESFMSQFVFNDRANYIDLLHNAIDDLVSYVKSEKKVFKDFDDYIKDTNSFLNFWVDEHITQDDFDEDPYNKGITSIYRGYVFNSLLYLRQKYYTLVPKHILSKGFSDFLSDLFAEDSSTKTGFILKRVKVADYILLQSLESFRESYKTCDIAPGSWSPKSFMHNYGPLPKLKFPKVENEIRTIEEPLSNEQMIMTKKVNSMVGPVYVRTGGSGRRSRRGRRRKTVVKANKKNKPLYKNKKMSTRKAPPVPNKK